MSLDSASRPVKTGTVQTRGGEAPLYIFPEAPFWFVPTPAAAEALRLCKNGFGRNELAGRLRAISGKSAISCELDAGRLLASLYLPEVKPYSGRRGRPLIALSEIWFHITEACNLKCGHCLFGGSDVPPRSLDPELIRSAITEAIRLGCRLVCFTGGEPFVYPGFIDLLAWILRHDDVRIAVLTNGLLLPRHIAELSALDRERLHFQVSLDGPRSFHERLRGKDTFKNTLKALTGCVAASIPCSAAMAINSENVSAMPEVPSVLEQTGVGTLHFQWHFKRGLGRNMDVPDEKDLFGAFRETVRESKRRGISIDNLEAVRAQVFTPAGTRFDLGNAAWESLAVGPDGTVYPTPAMIGRKELGAGMISRGLERVWRESPLLRDIRRTSLLDSPEMAADPWRFVIGGGDIDRCLTIENNEKQSNVRLGTDPYAPLYREMARILIEEEIHDLPVPDHPGVMLRMGDVTCGCPSGEEVNFTHCNCLLSMGKGGKQGLVRSFYAERAAAPDELILNPVRYPEDRIGFVPEEAKVRMYGCGSPVDDASLRPGEVVVDLGCGTGVECFIAAKKVGRGGRAVGIDMTEAMLDIARKARKSVRRSLGFANTEFIRGYLEAIPLGDNTADVVVSNCVLNLTGNKRRVFNEIFRVLKPGGRLVISDVVTESEPALKIRSDHQLTGECIGGAFVQGYLFSLLRDTGFVSTRAIKRFPYRTIRGHRFYSLTFSAWRPYDSDDARKQTNAYEEVVYSGPLQAVLTEDGTLLAKGERTRIKTEAGLDPDALSEGGIFALDPSSGAVLNVEGASSCSCFMPSRAETTRSCCEVPATGCLICGLPLTYLKVPRDKICARCGKVSRANALCEEGHFVCDLCHIQDPLELIRKTCLETDETDMIRLLNDIRSHSIIPMHGPEHHALVPGIILAAYKNSGGPVNEEDVLTGIERGALVPGGACAFMGSCGAVMGMGVALSIMLGATPLTPGKRQKVQRLVSRTLNVIADLKAARCCQRESYMVLKETSRISEELLPVALKAEGRLVCAQHVLNTECIKFGCPLYPRENREKFSILVDHVEPASSFVPKNPGRNRH